MLIQLLCDEYIFMMMDMYDVYDEPISLRSEMDHLHKDFQQERGRWLSWEKFQTNGEDFV